MFDTSDIYSFVPVVIMVVWMTVIQFIAPALTPEVYSIVRMLGLVFAFLGLYVLQIFLKDHVAGYPFFNAIVISKRGIEWLRFYAQKPILISAIDGEPYEKSAKITLPWTALHEYYGKIHELTINFTGQWSDRVHFEPDEAYYADLWLNHAQTTLMLLEDRGAGVERGEDKPVFDLVWGTGDVSRPMLTYISNFIKYSMKKTEDEPNYEVDLKSKEELKREVFKVKALQRQDHTKLLAVEETYDLKNDETELALNAVPGTVREAATSLNLAYDEAGIGLEGGIHKSNKHSRFRNINKPTAAMILGLAGVVFLMLRPETIDQLINAISIQTNQVFLVAITVCVTAIYFLSRRK